MPRAKKTNGTAPVDINELGVIHDNVPIPPKHKSHGEGPVTSLLNALKVGQSVAFPYERHPSIYSMTTRIHRDSGGTIAFTGRKIGDTLRIWREA